MIAALAGANPQLGQTQEDERGDLDHSNPEVCSSATHFDVLAPYGRRSLVKRARIRSDAHAGDRQTVNAPADDVCVCVSSPVPRIHRDANTAPLSDWNHELQG